MQTRSADASELNFSWVLRLRWLALAGQAALLAFASGVLHLKLPLGLLAVALGVGLSSNAGLALFRARGGRATENRLLAVMVFDSLLLTVLLYLSGGPFNPFSALFIVNVALGAVVLSSRRAWVLLVVSLAAFAALFPLQHVHPPGVESVPDHASLMTLHLNGMWLAFGLAAALTLYFVQRVQKALEQQRAALAEAQDLASRHEKLSALTRLAAGAAHELATPLGTIALVSSELERALQGAEISSEAREDLQLIRREVTRCRAILDSMGEATGEAVSRFSAREWVTQALAGVDGAERVQVELPDSLEVSGPKVALAQALRSLVRNALEASPTVALSGRFRVSATQTGAQEQMIEFEVRDSGPGISVEVLSRIGEPFFTTREVGKGMGLGVFLARSVAEQLGGGVALESQQGKGTVARLWIARVPT